MLVNCDVKGLEVVVAAELSGDKVLCQEVRDGVDFHEENRRLLGFTERRDAKFFKFRLLYGTSAYGFTHDSLFIPISSSEKYWQEVIDKYYDKYQGIRKWHSELIATAMRDGQLEIPSGRIFPITPDYNKREPWPHTIIKNYPVQGFGADLVMLARLQARKLMQQKQLRSLLISTIHDSIVADCPDDEVETMGRILNQAVEDVPRLCKQVFDYEFSLPMTAEVQYGPNKKEMKDLIFTT
jgi:DNA polymerase-1